MTETITTTTEQFPIGSRWKHDNVDYPVIVTGGPFQDEAGATRYPVSNDITNETIPNGWVKGALEMSESLDKSSTSTLRERTLAERIAHLQAEVEGLRQTISTRDRNITQMREANERLQQHLYDLGKALRDEAINRDWCAEYDAFAEQWDLPQREAEYNVTITVRITARDEDAALEIAHGGVSLDSYHTTGVSFSPEYEVEMVS